MSFGRHHVVTLCLHILLIQLLTSYPVVKSSAMAPSNVMSSVPTVETNTDKAEGNLTYYYSQKPPVVSTMEHPVEAYATTHAQISSSGVPESVVPESVVPESVVPESVGFESVNPESVVPESVVPESVVPESVVPESVNPENVVPESFFPEGYVPESINPFFEPHGLHFHFSMWMNLSQPTGCDISLSCELRQDRNEFKQTPSSGDFICQCDVECLFMGDCCQDFFETSLNIHTGSQMETFLAENSSTLFLPQSPPPEKRLENAAFMYKSFGTCEQRTLYHTGNLAVEPEFWIVSRCPSEYVNDYIEGIKDLCEGDEADTEFSFPVSHRWNDELIFKNVYCAMCHGVEMRDILFWKINLNCPWQGPAIKSYDELRDFLNLSQYCRTEIMAVRPRTVRIRKCSLSTESVRCSPKTVDDNPHGTTSHVLLHKTLCNIYLQPVLELEPLYANMHCASCSGEDLDQARSYTCFKWLPPLIHLSEPALVSLAFRNARLEVSSYVTYVNFSSGEYEQSWKTNREQRHENCWAASEDLRFQFLSQCQTYQCPQQVQLPVANLSGINRLCSVRKYEFVGDYGSVFSSRDNGSHLYMKLEVTGVHFSLLIANVFRILNDVIDTHMVNVNSHQLRLLEIKSVTRNRYLIRWSWTSEDGYITVLQLAELLQRRFNKDQTFQGSNSTLSVSNFLNPRDVCHAGDVLEYRHVDLMPFGYKSLFVLKDIRCYLDLERVGFGTVLTGGSGMGYPPSSIDRVFLCNSSQIEAICGTVPKSESVIEAVSRSQFDFIPVNINDEVFDMSDIEVDANDDTQLFQRMIYGLCALIELLLSFRCAMLLMRNRRTKSCYWWYLIHLFVGITFMALMILYLIAPDIHDRGKIIMGALSHFCWLCFASMVTVHLLHLVLRNREHSFAKSDEENLNCETKLPSIIMKILPVLMVLIVGICLIIEVDLKDLEIGYSHQTGHLLWLSNRTTCLVAFVMPCAIFLLVIVVLPTLLCFGMKKSNDEEEETESLASRTSVVTKSEFVCQVTFVLLLAILLVDYFYDGRPVLCSLLFTLVSGVFCAWHAKVVLGSMKSSFNGRSHLVNKQL